MVALIRGIVYIMNVMTRCNMIKVSINMFFYVEIDVRTGVVCDG